MRILKDDLQDQKPYWTPFKIWLWWFLFFLGPNLFLFDPVGSPPDLRIGRLVLALFFTIPLSLGPLWWFGLSKEKDE